MLGMGAQETSHDRGRQTACPLVRIEAERLPDLNIPRAGHHTFYINHEIVVVGGHTTGFVPTATAEYFSDGQWHLLPTVYEHDAGFFVTLKTGKVLIAGGFEKHLGIGQTFTVETYDPIRHNFEGFGCLNQKRAMAKGLALDSGQVVITGNWYADDAVETFDGQHTFTFAKAVSQQRAMPYILQTAKDDAMLFSSRDTRANPFDVITIDRLKGASFQAPLFDTWEPLFTPAIYNLENSFIGDRQTEVYAYLFPVIDKDGQIGIAQTRGADISLLPTTCPIPMKSPWGQSIDYYSNIIIDQPHQRGYLVGINAPGLENDDSRVYVLCVEYGKAEVGEAAPITLYYTDPLPWQGGTTPILTDDGDLVLAGGSNGKENNGTVNDNFHPYATVTLLHLTTPVAPQSLTADSLHWAGWLLLGLLVTGAIGIALFLKHQRHSVSTGVPPGTAAPATYRPRESPDQLMVRIRDLMEQKRPYLNRDLKITDIADELGVHRNQIANCLSTQTGTSFPKFITAYRVEYAKQLIQAHPEMKMAMISEEAGFANESTFFRAFKSITGLTPSGWKNKG